MENKINSTFRQSLDEIDPNSLDDESPVELQSPPRYVTFRPQKKHQEDTVRQVLDKSAFQNTILTTMENFFEKQEKQFNMLVNEFGKLRESVDFINSKFRPH